MTGAAVAGVAPARKYELTDETKIVFGVTLHRIRALVDIAVIGVTAGALGGWIEREGNLAHDEHARVSGNARVWGNASVSSPVVTATRTDGYTFLIAPTPVGPCIIAGCRYFSLDEARAHWARTRAGTKLGDESLALVDHLERMAVLNGFMEPVAVEAGK